MDFILIMSIMQLVIGIILFTMGIIARNSSGHENKKRFFNKMKNQGILNIILGVIAIILPKLNEELMLISMVIYAVGILFTTIYLLINLILLVKKSTMIKRNKILVVIGILLLGIYMFFGRDIEDKLKIGYRKFDEPIAIGEEFLLYKCGNKSHGNEKVYMTINKIDKDNGSCVGDDDTQCTVMDFDLRYEGKKPIKLIGEDRSFSDLCSFITTVSSNNHDEDEWEDEFIIENDMEYDIIHSDYAKNLPKIIKPGTILKNLTHTVAVMGVGYDNIPVEDMDIQIETNYKMQHNGENIRESIKR